LTKLNLQSLKRNTEDINMKSLILSFLLIAGFTVSTSMAQCSDKEVRKNTKSGLESYVFETASAKSYNTFSEPRNIVDAAITVFADEDYRFINLCNGFDQAVEWQVIDANGKAIFTGKGEQKFFDYKPRVGGDFILRFKFKEISNPNACVAYAVGYKL